VGTVATLICVLVTTVMCGIGGLTYGWYLGYHAGLEDGETGVSQVWPWNETTRTE
jgi:hypothetical protein